MKDIFKTGLAFANKHKDIILTGASIAGVITTAVVTAACTSKAQDILNDEMELRRNPNDPYYNMPITKKDAFNLTWKCAIPVFVTAAGTTSLIVAKHNVAVAKQASLVSAAASAYKMVDDNKRALSMITERLSGKEKKEAEEITRNEVSQPIAQRAAVAPENAVIVNATKTGSKLFIESISGRTFYSTDAEVSKAVARTNRDISQEGRVTINTLYTYLGLDPIAIGDSFEWDNMNGDIVDTYYTAVMIGDEACVSIEYHTMPSAVR